MDKINRRDFLKTSGLGAAALTLNPTSIFAQDKKKKKEVIQGFEEASAKKDIHEGWVPVSDRKIKVGLVGHGFCKFAAAFGFQDHPNVEVAAVSDLIPERCQELAKAARCSKTYPSLEELVKDPEIEAVYIATDAPSHFKHVMLALEHGKHVACAVPAVFGSLEDAYALYDKVKTSGLTYMLFETSAYHEDLYAMRQLYKGGILGKITYAEGEYYHYMPEALESYKDWRVGTPPSWYPTHANAYYNCVTDGSFSEVSCIGIKSIHTQLMGNNVYGNPFGTEISLYKTSDGGAARMAISKDTPGYHGEIGRIRGQFGTFYDEFQTDLKDLDISKIDTSRPPLPPTMSAGFHGGSHGNLTNEFVCSILENRKPYVDVAMALNLTVPGIVAHQSALRDGELMKIPQFQYWR